MGKRSVLPMTGLTHSVTLSVLEERTTFWKCQRSCSNRPKAASCGAIHAEGPPAHMPQRQGATGTNTGAMTRSAAMGGLSGSGACPDLESAAAGTTKQIGSTTDVQDYHAFA